MFNSIRKSQPMESFPIFPSPKYSINGVQIDGESVIDVSLPRELVDKRVKVASAKPLNLMANGIKPGNIKISSPIEDGLKAVEMVRNIISSAEDDHQRAIIREKFESALSSDPSSDSSDPSSDFSDPS